MGGKIDCYLDLASLYSYLAFLELQKNASLLASHDVEVEFHPMLLGAVNAGSGNRPPWTVPAKATYGMYDAARSAARHPGLKIQPPQDLMEAGKTVIPQRCLHYIKQKYSTEVFLQTMLQEIVQGANSEDLKTKLKETTQRGRSLFFGSDRFHFVYRFLGLPYRDVELLPASMEKGKL
ncbi:hypothetical protein N0V88_005912 [Collariella sp. IMI 366227]|nr:hypothetical protein N0V88_005912 [Collariella sp. IMI 366227]